MAFVLFPLNHGDGTGGAIICDQFAQGGNTATVVFSGIVFGPTGGPYTSVSTANPLPVAIESALPAGTNVIGHVIVDSIAALPALPPHQSTNVDQIGGAAIALGQAASAASVPVVIASNQSAVPVSGTLTADQGGVWTVGLSAGTQVEITDGTNTLGTPTHPVRVDPVGTTTQPVSGTVTANAGTNLNTSALALESGGNLATLAGAVSGGKVNVEIANASLTVAGTVTADQGGTWTITTNADGSASGGAAAGKSFLIGGQYNATSPTLTDGQQAAAQLDANGNLKVNIVGGGSGSNAAASATGSAIPAEADYGGLNVAGTLRGQTGVNPSGSVYAAQVDLASINGTALGGTLPVSGDVTSNQGSPASLASAWPVQITDGTHIMPPGDAPVRAIYTNASGTVAVSGVAGTVAVTGTFWQATQPVSGTIAATQSGTWNISTVNTVSAVTSITNALPAGTNNIGYVTPAAPGGAVGATPFHSISAANTTPLQIKGSAGTLYDVIGFNVSASAVAFAKFYDTVSAPIVGTTIPAYVVPLPTAGSTNGAGAARSWPVGLKFANGIWLAITGGMADNDNTAPAAGQVLVDGSFA